MSICGSVTEAELALTIGDGAQGVGSDVRLNLLPDPAEAPAHREETRRGWIWLAPRRAGHRVISTSNLLG